MSRGVRPFPAAVLAAALLPLATSGGAGTPGGAIRDTPAASATRPAAGAVRGGTGDGPAALTPVRMAIPIVDISAPVEAVGLTAPGDLESPADPASAGWYRFGAVPGLPGDAIVVGHSQWTTGDAAFHRLHELHPGDAIVVSLSDGTAVGFRVAGLSYHLRDARLPELFAGSGAPELSLITCAGRWDERLHAYLERLVVTATLASPPLASSRTHQHP